MTEAVAADRFHCGGLQQVLEVVGTPEEVVELLLVSFLAASGSVEGGFWRA
jgi:spore maturation protein SpmB